MEKEKLCRSKVTVKVNKKEIVKFFEDYEKGEACKDFLIYYIKPKDIEVKELDYKDCKQYEKKSSYQIAKEILKQEGFHKMKFDYTDKGCIVLDATHHAMEKRHYREKKRLCHMTA